jgi:hypothetical protein
MARKAPQIDRCGWARLQDGSWAVKVIGSGGVDKLSGQTVTVTKRDGRTAQVQLGSFANGTSEVALYKPVAKGKSAERQPDAERSDAIYVVTVAVQGPKGTVQWQLPVASRAEHLKAETSIEVARAALFTYDILGTTPTGTAKAARGRKPAAVKSAAKTTTKSPQPRRTTRR